MDSPLCIVVNQEQKAMVTLVDGLNEDEVLEPRPADDLAVETDSRTIRPTRAGITDSKHIVLVREV